jgi:hypothetical protein
MKVGYAAEIKMHLQARIGACADASLHKKQRGSVERDHPALVSVKER